MVNYSKSKIYKIVNDTNGMTYYGSTTMTLCRRMTAHRLVYKKNKISTYKDFGNIEDCKIFLVEDCPCDNKEQLDKIERDYIENNNCVNKNIPGRKMKEYNKIYAQCNKEALKEKFGAIRKEKFDCDCGGHYTYSAKARHMKTEKHKNYIISLQNSLPS